MAEVRQYVFTQRELAEALIRKQGLHEGVWTVMFEFGLGAGNVPSPSGEIVPGAILAISKVGLQKADKEGPGAVDASKVNPRKAG